MPFIKSLVSKYCTYIVALILSLGVIIPLYSYCAEKGLVYIIITAFTSCLLSPYFKCIKLNIYFSCNIKLVFNAKYTFFMCFISL